MKIKLLDGSWKAEGPIKVKQPSGDWRTYYLDGTTGTPLKQRQSDGTWINVAWSEYDILLSAYLIDDSWSISLGSGSIDESERTITLSPVLGTPAQAVGSEDRVFDYHFARIVPPERVSGKVNQFTMYVGAAAEGAIIRDMSLIMTGLTGTLRMRWGISQVVDIPYDYDTMLWWKQEYDYDTAVLTYSTSADGTIWTVRGSDTLVVPMIIEPDELVSPVFTVLAALGAGDHTYDIMYYNELP